MGLSGLERGAMVQIMLSLERWEEVKKEQGRMTRSPLTTSRLDSLTKTRSAAESAEEEEIIQTFRFAFL